MKVVVSPVLATLLASIAAVAAVAAPERSISTSRQFIVYGPDAQLRGAICDIAEQTKAIPLRLLQQRDEWKTPVIVHAQLPQANLPEIPRAKLNFSQTGFGLKIQLDLTIDAGIAAPSVQRELLRAVLLEMMYRQQQDTPAGTPYVEPPDWLLDGMLALEEARESPRMAESLATMLALDRVIPLQEFLRQQPALLETPSRTLYRAYSAALLGMLTQSPGGAARLTRFVHELPSATNDPLADLRAHFPEIGDTPEKLQHAWNLAVTRFSAREKYRLLSVEETERQLAELLRIEVRE